MSTEEESSKSNNGIHDENSFEPKETKLASQGKENFIEINSTEPLKQGFLAILMRQKHLDLLAIFLAETIGTGLLVFLGCMSAVDGFHYQPTHLSIALAFGLAVMLIINIFGCVSGSQLNPVISLAAVIYEIVPIPLFFLYFVAQLLGGYLGYALLRVVTPSEFFHDNKFCVSAPSVTDFEGFIIEFIITIILVFVYCGMIDPRNIKHHDSIPLRFGLAVTCLALVAGSYSGGSMNPARSFGPALYNWYWKSHWIYWAGPFAGGIAAALVYRTIFYRKGPLPLFLTLQTEKKDK